MFKVNELLRATAGKLISGHRDASLKGISIDTRTIKPQEAFLAIKGNNFDGHKFINEAIKRKAACVIYHSHPSSLMPHAAEIAFIKVKDTARALGDIARSSRNKFDIPVIVVTGSNGKTTTKDMIAAVLSKKFNVLRSRGTQNNHIGLPLTLLGLKAGHDMAVLEAGTNHPGEIEYLARIACPNIAVITNIGPSHLQYFKGLRAVFKEKVSLLKHLKRPGIAILNTDDCLLNKLAGRKAGGMNVIGFGSRSTNHYYCSGVNCSGSRLEFVVNAKHRFTLKTPAPHNIYNALAAISAARIFGVEYKDIIAALSSFEFAQNRLSLVKLKNVNFINDTYNSNPSSLRLALDVLESFKVLGRKIFVMGDMLELGDCSRQFHRQAGERIAHACDVFIAVGPLTKFAADTARGNGLDKNNIFICGNNQEARDILFGRVMPCVDDLVLVKGSRSMRMEEIFNF